MVKKFLKSPGGVELYPSVNIEWIKGHDPTLYVTGDGPAEEIGLGKFNYTQLHELFARKFGRVALRDEAAGSTWKRPAADDAGSPAGAGSRRPLFMLTGGAIVTALYAAAARRSRARGGWDAANDEDELKQRLTA